MKPMQKKKHRRFVLPHVPLIVAPTTVVRYLHGQLAIHTTTAIMHVDDPDVLVLLSRFALPCRPAAAIETSHLDRRTATRVVQLLIGAGILVFARSEKARNDIPIDAAEHTFHDLTVLAQTVHRLAGDIGALDTGAEDSIASETGVGLSSRLESLLAGAGGLEAECAKLRGRFLSSQTARLKPRGKQHELRLNVGAGRFPLKSWINVGLPPAPLIMNLQRTFPFPDSSVSCAFMSHVLEHFYYPDEALRLTKELRRVLRPNAPIRIVVPDIEKWLTAYVNRDRRFFQRAKEIWRFLHHGTRLEQVLLYAGSGASSSPGAFFGHKMGYDCETLKRLLRRAGFRQIERSGFMQSRHAALRVDNHSAVADAVFDGGHYSLFVEAIK
jgi:predicted SAM-dependent methyltransferase